TTGKTVNVNYPHAWRYRDWVIAAFNADKPYDQFVREQLAGDLLPTTDPKQRAERVVATGFLAIGPKALNERNGLQFELDVADERKRTEEQIKTIQERKVDQPIQRIFIAGQVAILQSRLDSFDADGNPKLLAMGVRDNPAGPAFRPGGPPRPGPGGFGPFAGLSRAIADSPVYT